MRASTPLRTHYCRRSDHKAAISFPSLCWVGQIGAGRGGPPADSRQQAGNRPRKPPSRAFTSRLFLSAPVRKKRDRRDRPLRSSKVGAPTERGVEKARRRGAIESVEVKGDARGAEKSPHQAACCSAQLPTGEQRSPRPCSALPTRQQGASLASFLLRRAKGDGQPFSRAADRPRLWPS